MGNDRVYLRGLGEVMTDEPKSTIKLSAKQVGELAEWIGKSIEKRKRTLVSDALKRQGIEVKPSEREVNILRRIWERKQSTKQLKG